MKRLVLLCLCSGLLLVGCGDDDAPAADARPPGDPDAAVSTPDAGGGDPDASGPSLAERGEYLVNSVIGCPDCHTPRNLDGTLDGSRYMAGEPARPFADLDPGDDGVGAVYVRNVTPHPTSGVGGWTDEQLKAAITDGVNAAGDPLFPIMPYYVLHNMEPDDLDAVVAYLRTIPAVDQEIPARQPLGFPFTAPADPIPVAEIPDTTLATDDPLYDSARRGRYLATQIGLCIECHTPPSAPPATVPIDMTVPFSGGRVFPAAEFGLPSPPFPDEIFTRNLTPHENGLVGWTAQQVATALKQGTDDDGDGLCPPMPAGPFGPYAGLTDADALAIGRYLTTLAPVASAQWPECTPPAGP